MLIEPIGLAPNDFEYYEEFEEAKERILGHLRKCALGGKIGLENPDLNARTVGVCLSKTQVTKLFGAAKPERLGCGTFACAWAKSKTRAAKITTDADDVTALAAGQGLPHVMKVYNGYRLIDAGIVEGGTRRFDLFGIVAERLLPPSEDMATWIDEFPTLGTQFVDWYGTHAVNPDDADPDFQYDPGTREAVQEACSYTTDDDTPERSTCEQFYGELVDTTEQLAKRGVNWNDIHRGNIGIDTKGIWKGLDLGVSGTGTAPDVPDLKGAAPRKIAGTFCETTKNPRRTFDARSFRYVPRGKNWLLIGCPKGKWDDRTNSCKVGTRAYKILKKTDRCPVGRRVTKG